MSLVFRIILIVASLLTLVFMMRKIRHSKVQIEDTIFWVLFSILLLVISIFPGLADFATRLVGVYSTVNFVFLLTIFILLIKLFLMTVKLSQVECKMRELAQKVAIDNNIKDKKEEDKE